MKKIVLTGGPGNGKTTIIEILASRGYAIVPEAARIIIDREKALGSDILPWKNLSAFQQEIAKMQLKEEEAISADLVFLDRSIVDGHAYCKVGNIPTPEIVSLVARNRYDIVFFIEPLTSYDIDDIRFENKKEALEVHRAIEAAYQEFGYNLISVPPLTPNERVDFILEQIKE